MFTGGGVYPGLEKFLQSEGEIGSTESDCSGSKNSGFRGAVSISDSERDMLFRGCSKFSSLPAAKSGLTDRYENKTISESRRKFVFFKNSRPRVGLIFG